MSAEQPTRGTPLDRITSSRRDLLRAAGIGLAIPAAGQLLAACSSPFGDDDAEAAEEDPEEPVHSVGSDADEMEDEDIHKARPTPEDVQPFEVYDPFLEPVEPGTKDVEVVAIDRTLYIARDVPYAAWTFDGTIPANTWRVRQGDTVNVTFRVDPDASIPHSLDFHSAQTPPNVNYRNISPGEELSYSFTPQYPGAFMFHCGTPPVLMHIAAGMYGAMIVDPAEGWPEAQELIFVQSEFYLREGDDGVMVPSMEKMMGNGDMSYVVFNGYANQYSENPITVRAGEPIRIFLVNAGPNIWSSFHVVGAIFDATYANANPANKLVGQQSVSIGPGDGACVEFTLHEPGEYIAVNHSFGHAAHGAIAIINAE